MYILVTGATGLLGKQVVRVLRERGHHTTGVSAADFDLRDGEKVRAAVDRYRPEAIIHCGAYTAVDRAESDVDACMAVNSMGTLHLARNAKRVGAKMLYISTDYVFGGGADDPHEEGESPAPYNVYGLSKWQGEEAVRAWTPQHFIVRTSWLYGPGGKSFADTMLRLGKSQSSVRVVADQFGAPTYTCDLARLMADMIETERYGVYHAAGAGACSFADWAEAIMCMAGLNCTVERITTREYAAAARRPHNSRLSMQQLKAARFDPLPDWQSSLARFVQLRER